MHSDGFANRALRGTFDLVLAILIAGQSGVVRADEAEPPAAAIAADPASAEGGSSGRPPWQEFTNSYEGIAGRASLQSFDLPVPEAGLYRVNWQAEIYSLEPQANLNGICSVAEAHKALFLDAVPYDQNTPASGYTSRDGSSMPYVYRRVGSEFVAYVAAGADLTLRCVSSAPAEDGKPVRFDNILAASLFARRME